MVTVEPSAVAVYRAGDICGTVLQTRKGLVVRGLGIIAVRQVAHVLFPLVGDEVRKDAAPPAI
jgi:hypothetical protein